MEPTPAEYSAPPRTANQPDTLLRIDSQTLLNGRNTVEIVHGDQRYLLRVTRENKLILTK